MNKKVSIFFPIIVAALLWFIMFSPWVSFSFNFWIEMSLAAIILTSLAFLCGSDWKQTFKCENLVQQVFLGIAIAAVLWGVFWVGDKLSQLMFGFARPQVDNIYGLKHGFPAWLIALLLLFVIGPAEEIFWRGYVQRNMTEKWGANVGFVVATLVYTFIHIWALNFMLLMAALVCGLAWGLLYRLKPQWLPAIIISHALWDAFVFVILPI